MSNTGLYRVLTSWKTLPTIWKRISVQWYLKVETLPNQNNTCKWKWRMKRNQIGLTARSTVLSLGMTNKLPRGEICLCRIFDGAAFLMQISSNARVQKKYFLKLFKKTQIRFNLRSLLKVCQVKFLHCFLLLGLWRAVRVGRAFSAVLHVLRKNTFSCKYTTEVILHSLFF